ncbi:MAG: hypothetical protein Ct9H300mP12_14470 [Acidimicrobiales bacterium]|nr:MAG: hypothetical protein Ct9H300mP12_14470 [Acidimicrobiales bacterium]
MIKVDEVFVPAREAATFEVPGVRSSASSAWRVPRWVTSTCSTRTI